MLWLCKSFCLIFPGFNTYIDLTYPLSTQTIVTDGHRWQFVAYQLNTLALWLDSKANDRANVCWVGDESELYATVEGGQVRGFNPSVLRQLISCLALAPADRPYNLRPTLSPTSLNPQLKEEFIPLKKEEVKVVYEEKYVDWGWQILGHGSLHTLYLSFQRI